MNWLRCVLFTLRGIYDLVIDTVCAFLLRKKTILPRPKDEFLAESASSLAEKIRTKKLLSETVVRACVDRIKEINPLVNAVIDDRFEAAISEAKFVDNYISTCSLTADELLEQKPFLGVPFTSKESTHAKGMSCTFGLVSRIGLKAEDDADIVTHMKNSGAILIAVTNIPELNMWCETRNNIFGQTVNPYNFNRTVGGSSGGEACLVTACASPLGLGTDIGGSIRMPSYFCGVFGHKPTSGVVSTKGMTFRTGTEGKSMCTAGSITRYSEDIIPFLKVIAHKNVDKLNLDKKVNLGSVRVFYITDPGDVKLSPVSPIVKAAIKKAAQHLSTVTKHSAKLIDVKEFAYSNDLWAHGMSKEKCNFAFDLSNRTEEVSLWSELWKLFTGVSKLTMPSIMQLIQKNILPRVDSAWGDKTTKDLLSNIQDLLKDDGVLLYPSCSTVAPYHYASLLRPFNFAYWGIFNALHLPVTNVPLGLSPNHLPVGLQVVASPYNDHLTIAVAQELEKACGGWVPPYDA